MESSFTLAVTGESILNRRISVCQDERVLGVFKIIREADVGFTQLETLIHDYDGPEVYPAAEAGHARMRSPRYVADELKWAGFDIVSHASNHSLDYSYGGLFSTWKALDDVGIPHAGTGRNLGDARSPVYLETAKGRVALISMCSSFAGWARAGGARPDTNGRPGVNPLRHYYLADAKTIELVRQLAMRMGFGVRRHGKMWLIYPPGVVSITKFVESDRPGITTAIDEDDAEGNIRSIKDARRQADWVLVHLHNHWCDFDPNKGYFTASEFVSTFARGCIDAGADVFIEDGAGRLPLRGIEIYKKKPILYHLGDFIRMSHTVTRLPADYYAQPGFPEELKSWKATPADAYDAREQVPKLVMQPSGSEPQPVSGCMVAVCSFGPARALTEIKCYPVTHVESPRSQVGIPVMADAEAGKILINFLADVSWLYGTRVEHHNGIGLIRA